MKRKISAILVALLMVTSFASCKDKTTSSEVEESSAIVSEAASEAVSDASAEVSEEASADESEVVSEEESSEEEIKELIDVSEMLKVADAFKGHLVGDMFSKLNLEKGFGFEMDISAEEADMAMAVSVNMYVKGNKICVELDMDLGFVKQKATTIYKKGAFYIVDHAAKSYRVSYDMGDFEEISSITSMLGGENIKFVKTEEKIIEGVKYIAEVYSIEDEEGFDSEISYCFVDGILKGAEFDGQFMKLDFVFEADDSVFEIPADYVNEADLGAGILFNISDEYKDLEIYKIFKGLDVENGFVMTAVPDEEEKSVLYAKGNKARMESYWIDEEGKEEMIDLSILKDGRAYTFDIGAKQYIEEDYYMFGLSPMLEGYEYSETVKETIDGVEYTVEIFEMSGLDFFDTEDAEDEYEFDMSTKFYIKDGELKFISIYGDMAKFEITKGGDIPDSLFEIPEGYTLVTEDEWYGNDDDYIYDENFDEDFAVDLE